MLPLNKFNIGQVLSAFCLLLLAFACKSSDDDGTTTPVAVKISVQDLSIDEGNVNKNVFVRLQLSASTDQLITAYISSKDVSASAGNDFSSFDNIPVVFPPGELIKDHQLQILGDEVFEEDEIFEVTIVSVEGNASIEKGTGKITIVNDDEGQSVVEIPTMGYSTPDSYPNMDLIWQDEFTASNVDMSNWTFELGNGNGGWGNNELQFYKNENTSIVDGHLVIEARKEVSGPQYTSSRIITKDKFDFKYGRVDIRAALPTGQGMWPALWMLGSNFQTVGWPACGEIDIMEVIGNEPNTCHGTAHWSNGGQHAQYGGNINSSSSLHEIFHVFSIVWTENQIKWLLDDVQYNVLSTSSSELSEFQGNFFFIFNVAVGGNWPGSPNASTQFPQRMIVDYIRVFQ